MRYARRILIFELFPAFILIVSAIVGVALYVANRASGNGEPEPLNPEPNVNTNPEARTRKVD